jgi:proline iminopeptidase
MKRMITYGLLAVLILSCAKKENQPEPYEEGTLDAGDGVQLFYQKVGNGEDKIIIPLGLFLFDEFKSLATDDRTLIFYDVRNRGRSSHVTDSTLIGIWQDVHDLETVRKHFGADKVSLIGWSYLGMMVMLYTTQYPENVERIVQVGPVALKWDTQFPSEYTNTDPVPFDTSSINEVERLRTEGLNQRDPKKFTELWYRAYVFPQLFSDTNNITKFETKLMKTIEPENELHDNFLWHIDHHFTGSIQKLNTDSLWKEVKKIELPVLTIHGTKDRNAVYGAGRQWAEELPNAKIITVENAAHLPWLEKSAEVFPPIDEFLNGKWPARAVKVE